MWCGRVGCGGLRYLLHTRHGINHLRHGPTPADCLRQLHGGVHRLRVPGEHDHERVAAELDHVSPVRVDDLYRELEEGGEGVGELLGASGALLAEGFGELGVAGNVKEGQDGGAVDEEGGVEERVAL